MFPQFRTHDTSILQDRQLTPVPCQVAWAAGCMAKIPPSITCSLGWGQSLRQPYAATTKSLTLGGWKIILRFGYDYIVSANSGDVHRFSESLLIYCLLRVYISIYIHVCIYVYTYKCI